jgi:hypothetical protein
MPGPRGGVASMGGIHRFHRAGPNRAGPSLHDLYHAGGATGNIIGFRI